MKAMATFYNPHEGENEHVVQKETIASLEKEDK
jgi:hypothetical protein